MTNGEAIKILHRLELYLSPLPYDAVQLAITALEKQTSYTHCGDCKFGVIERQWIKCNYHNIFMKAEDACSKGVKRINERPND